MHAILRRVLLILEEIEDVNSRILGILHEL